MARPLVFALVLLLPLSGCLDLFGADDGPAPYSDLGWKGSDASGQDGAAWPNVRGELRVLVTGDFPAFDKLAEQFEDLTGVLPVREDEADPVKAVEQLSKGEEAPADVIVGLDNMLLLHAAEEGVLDPYTPLLGDRIMQDVRFLEDSPDYGTPFEHVYYAVHWAPDHEETNATGEGGAFISDIFQVRERSDLFTTVDPRTGDPAGLAFLWMTVGLFGDDRSDYDWRDFWRELLVPPQASTPGGVVTKRGLAEVAPTEEAAHQEFTAALKEGVGRPVAWFSTTTEAAAAEEDVERPLARVLLDNGTTWHRINTAAVVAGTPNLAAAQAWVEFLLTDHAQKLLAQEHLSYPVVEGISTKATFGGGAPEPGTFRPAFVDPLHAGVRAADWLEEFDGLAADWGI